VSQPGRVAVGRGGSDPANPNRARSAGHVLDDDRLTERLAHALGHDAADRIGRAARSKRDEQRDRPRRIRLSPCNGVRPYCERKYERELLSHAEITRGAVAVSMLAAVSQQWHPWRSLSTALVARCIGETSAPFPSRTSHPPLLRIPHPASLT